jgi:hypothetical protein
VRFALSSATAWRDIDLDFNHHEFYSTIVNYFEVTPDPVAQAHVDDLLAGWNQFVSVIYFFSESDELSLFSFPGKFLAAHRDLRQPLIVVRELGRW